MKRLALQLSSTSREHDNSSVEDYKEATKAWNQNLGSIYVRLSQLGKTQYRYKLESELHNPMRRASVEIDKALHDTIHRQKLVPVIYQLNSITRSALNYNERLLREVHNFRRHIYFPEKIYFSRDTMFHFSTWQLVKAIFVADVNRISVIRSPLNS